MGTGDRSELSARVRAALTPGRLVALGAVWLAIFGGALGLALLLDDPVGEGARDEAQPIVAGPVVGPGQELTGREGPLPPLAMVLDRPPPQGLGRLEPEQRIPRLLELASVNAEPRRLVELGVAYQEAGDTGRALGAYEDALRLDPGDLAARVGLAMATGATGSDGLERAGEAMDLLAEQVPRSQLVQFNRAWLGLYREDAETVLDGWRRTRALDATSPLGVTATTLLQQVEEARSETGTSPNP